MKKYLKKIFGNMMSIFIFLLSSSIAISEEAYIASFNALRLGRNEKNYLETAHAIKKFELIGIVEVMNRRGIEELADALEKVTGEKWSYHISPYGQGSGDYKEYYGYIWRKKDVTMIKSMGFYEDSKKDFIRPPYGTSFKIGNFDFTLVMSHSIFGKNQSVRKAEAYSYDKVYDYFQSLDEKEKDIIIAGDFNLPADDEAFENLTRNHKERIIYAVDPKLKTTIGNSGFSNSYDNIFLSMLHTKEFRGKSGKYDFTKGDFKGSRKNISDHLPIFIIVDTDEDDD